MTPPLPESNYPPAHQRKPVGDVLYSLLEIDGEHVGDIWDTTEGFAVVQFHDGGTWLFESVADAVTGCLEACLEALPTS